MELWPYPFLILSVILNIFWFFCIKDLRRRLTVSNNYVDELSDLRLAEKAVASRNLMTDESQRHSGPGGVV